MNAIANLLPNGRDLDWQAITDAFDWIRAMQGSTQDPRHHAEGDVWTHTRMVTEELLAMPNYQRMGDEDRLVLFATALLHDVAKPVTRREEDGRITNRGHSRVGAVMARAILWRMGFPAHQRERVCTLIAFHQAPFWFIERPEWEMSRIVAEVSLSASNRLLGVFAEADARGRICDDKPKMIENTMLFREWAVEMECYAKPRAFVSDHARVRYFRDPEQVFIGAEPFDTTSAEFTVTLMSGLPASGKSTHVAKLGLPVVSLDGLRAEMGISPEDEQGSVVQAARERAKQFLRGKSSFVWDGTNLSREMRGLTLPMLLDYGARVRIVYVEAPPAVVAERNRARRRDMVPDAAIERMLRRWEVPTLVEAHEVRMEVQS